MTSIVAKNRNLDTEIETWKEWTGTTQKDGEYMQTKQKGKQRCLLCLPIL